jgi:hypothetical protein
MAFIQGDDVVQHLSTATSNPPFRYSVGEGRQLHRMATLPILRLKSSILIIH